MKLSKEQEEKLVMGIQAVLGITIIGLSVKNSAKVQTKAMKKLLKKDVRRSDKLHRLQFKQEKRLLKRKYKDKLRKNSLRRQARYGKIMG